MRALARRLPRLARPLLAALAALSLSTLGCAGHEDRLKSALDALDRGEPREAVVALNEQLEVDRAEDLPKALEGDNALLVLDRATVLQSLDDYKLSQRDFGAADKSIEVLDFSRSAADDVGKYLFSDDVGPYKAPAYEKLLVNTMNMMNYLAQGDLQGAKVEARRLAVMQKFIKDRGEENAMLGLGSYLAGFAFEHSGSPSEALLYYDDALRYAQYPSLRDPLRVLTQGQPKSPGIDALVGGAGALPPVAATGEADLCVVVGFGRVPQKIPVRIPIGLALTFVSGSISPNDAAQANALAAKGLVTWVNYPTLGKARGRYSIPTFSLDGRPLPMEEALDVEAEVRTAWKEIEGTIILSAITRMVARAVAGEVAAGATRAASDSGPLGLIVGLAATAALSAADTPDTRSWATLPSRIAIARLRVPAGTHEIRLAARGLSKTYRVTLGSGGWGFVAMNALR
jgi:tetratricopeptide (TPR) repeat protein